MLDWEKVVQNRELLTKVEELVDEVADTFDDFPQDVCDQLNQLTGNDWTGDIYIEYCAEYWESPWTLEEVVYALFHDGKYPDKKRKDMYAWSIGQSIEKDEDVISFFRFGKDRDNEEMAAKYEDVDVRQLYKELAETFSEWNAQADEWEKEDYKSFRATNQETYGYEKVIDIYNGYGQKFLNCTLTNMNEDEKEVFVRTVQKYCNHVVEG